MKKKRIDMEASVRKMVPMTRKKRENKGLVRDTGEDTKKGVKTASSFYIIFKGLLP